MSNPVPPVSIVSKTLGLVGFVLYVLVGFLYMSSGLVVPLPWVVFLWILWLAGWYVVVRVHMSNRAWVPVVAIGAVLVWWVYLTLGGLLLGWTA